MLIDWRKYDENTKEINLENNQITEINWNGCPQGLKEINLSGNQITDIVWENCPQGLEKISLYGNQITHINWNGCPLYLEYVSPYTEKYKNYKQTLEYKMRFYGKENLLRNLITRERRIINDEIVALSYIPDNYRVKVFNTKIFKENYYNFLETIKNDLKTINDV